MLKERITGIVEDLESHKAKFVAGAIGASTALMPMMAFASGEVSLPSVTIDAALVAPIVTAISSGFTTLLPIGIAIMSIKLGVALIPRVIYQFF